MGAQVDAAAEEHAALEERVALERRSFDEALEAQRERLRDELRVAEAAEAEAEARAARVAAEAMTL
eukprot:1028790-Prymnesium_polylepis.1